MKNWEVEAILKFYKDIDLDIKVTGEWLERYESVYDTTGAINYDGMPHGSNTSDSTALLAIEIAGTDTAERIKGQNTGVKEIENGNIKRDLFLNSDSQSYYMRILLTGSKMGTHSGTD